MTLTAARGLLVVAVLAAWSALADGCVSDEAVAASAAIISGDDDTGDPAMFPTVGYVTSSGDCTGTLISPSHVVLAAHCVAGGTATTVDFAAHESPTNDDSETFAVAACWMMNGYTAQNVRSIAPQLRDSGESDTDLVARLED